MLCKICEVRRPRRYCPGVAGDICSQCCGREREVTVDCPLDCEYLREARKHEKTVGLDPSNLPHPEVRISDEFLARNEGLLYLLTGTTAESAFTQSGVVDSDVREALEAMVRTYRTLQSGLIYSSVPTNPLAAQIYNNLQQRIGEARERIREQNPAAVFLDTDVLGILVFLHRMSIQYDNGRRKGRAFMDFLSQYFKPAQPAAGGLLIQP